MINLFGEEPIFNYIQLNMLDINREISKVTNCSAVDADYLSESITHKCRINVPKIKEGGITFSLCMEYDQSDGHSKVAVVTYSIPFSGNGQLFSFKPTQHHYNSIYQVDVADHLLKFKIYTRYINLDLPDKIKEEVSYDAKRVVDWIQTSLGQLNHDCTAYNNKMERVVKEKINGRLSEIPKSKDMLEGLNPFK